MRRATGSNRTPQTAKRVSVQLTLDGHFFSESATEALRGAEVVELLTAATLLVPRALYEPAAAAALFAAAGMPLAEGMCTVCAAAEDAEGGAAAGAADGGGAVAAADADRRGPTAAEGGAATGTGDGAGAAERTFGRAADAAPTADGGSDDAALRTADEAAHATHAAPLVAVMALAETTLRTIEERCGASVRYAAPLLQAVEPTEPTVWVCDTGRVLYLRCFDPALQLAEALPVETDEERAYLVERLCERIDAKRCVLLLDDRSGCFRRFRHRFKKTIPCA